MRAEETALIERRLIRRTATDYLLYFPTRVIVGTIGLISVAILSKFFTPAQYGHYILALNLLTFLSMVTSIGLRGSIIRLLPQYEASGQLAELAATLTLAGTALTVLVLAVTAVALWLLRGSLTADLYHLLWLALLGVPLLTVFAVIINVYRIQGQAASYCALDLWRVLGGLSIGLWLALSWGLGVAGLLLGLIAVLAVANAWHLIRYLTQLSKLSGPPRFSIPILKDIVAFNGPILGLNLASSVLSVSDRYLMEAFLSSYAVGIYSASYTLADGTLRLIATTFMLTVGPIMVTTWEKHGQDLAYRFIERLFRYYVLLATPALVGLILLRREAISILTTPDYVPGSAVIIWVGIALFFHGYTLVIGSVFDLTKKTMIPFINFMIASIFSVIVNVVLLPRFGYMAAAWTTCAAYGLLLALAMIACRRIVRLKAIGDYAWKVPVAAVVMGLAVILLKSHLPSSLFGLAAVVILGMVMYGVVVLLLGTLSEDELHGLRQLVSALLGRVRRSKSQIGVQSVAEPKPGSSYEQG
jgi:O-antigen/teichoic acid export membrane protein